MGAGEQGLIYAGDERLSTKKHLLALLETSRGRSISGEHIAKQLKVSRNAVWKAIQELKKEGYRIQAVTNKGYCLCEDNDILSVQGMLPFLVSKSSADRVIIHTLLASTNQSAKELAVAGAEHGTVIIADGQTAGRGRYGRQFHSPPGKGIYMSFILHPAHLKLKTPTLITAFAAVAVCEAIEAVTKKAPRIKWVNDIYVDEKKICGILTEAVTDLESGGIQWVVVGIGINFSTPDIDFPEAIRQVAGSIFPNGQPTTTRNHLIAEVINRVLERGDRFNEDEILDRYRERLLMLGKKVFVVGAQETYEATAIDIDQDGRLIVKKESGEVQSLYAGEISIRY